MIRLNQPVLGQAEVDNVVKALRATFISGLAGDYVPAFEQGFSAFCGVSHGVATCNGTAALHLALASLGIQSGDEVIIPTFTHISSAFATIYCGATPVLADCDRTSFTIDPADISRKLTPRTKAILAVHMYGHPAPMPEIVALARAHGCYVIEDGAEAHGATVADRRVGSFGHASVFSFLSNKIITCGEGGMLVTNDSGIAERARRWRNLSFGRERKFFHEELGFNYRLSNVLAAIGVAQLPRIDAVIEHKRYLAAAYRARLSSLTGLTLPTERSGSKHVYWVYPILVDPVEFGCDRDALMRALDSMGIETRPTFVPMHVQPALLKRGLFAGQHQFHVADFVSAHGLYLSTGSDMTEAQVMTVTDAIVRVHQDSILRATP